MTGPTTIYGLPVIGEAENANQLVTNMHVARWAERLQQHACREHDIDLHDRFVSSAPIYTVIRRPQRRSKAGSK